MGENGMPAVPKHQPPKNKFADREAFSTWIDDLHNDFRGYDAPEQLWQIYADQYELVRYYDSKISSFSQFLVAGAAALFTFSLTQLGLARIVGVLNIVLGFLGLATVIWYASAYKYHWELMRAFRRAYLKSLKDSKPKFLWRGVHMKPSIRYPRITNVIPYNAVWIVMQLAVIASGIVLVTRRDWLARLMGMADRIAL